MHPRRAFLSPALRALRACETMDPKSEKQGQAGVSGSNPSVRFIMVCLSYRSYWTSNGGPSETGIAEDDIAALEWITSQPRRDPTDLVPAVLWGQSIGARVATNLAASHGLLPRYVDIKMLILETPITTIRDILVTICRQKWLPYQILWPFL